MKEIIVIGAGISGLATAFEVRRKAHEAGIPANVRIIEKEVVPGGKMRTEIVEGYTCEWGPNGYLDSKVHATEFCEMAGLKDELVPASNIVNRRFLYSRKKLWVLPESPPRFFLSGLLSLRGRLRIMLEPLIKRALPEIDESVSEFATRRLGKEALEMLLDPFVSGVFAGNPDALSLKSCFPRIHEMEQTYGSLVRALFALRKKRKLEKKKAREEGKAVAGATAPRGHLTSLKKGMGQLIEALAGHFDGSLHCGSRIDTLGRSGDGLNVIGPDGEIKADAVVLAVPAYRAAGILSTLAPEAKSPLKGVDYNGLWVICMGFDKSLVEHPLDGYGFLIPRIEKRSILGCLWSSSIFPGRAPDGKVMLRIMAGGARNPEKAELSEDEIVSLARQELDEILGISVEPEFVRAIRHERAIPQYTIGHATRIEEVGRALADTPGIFLTGNSYRGVAMADCILDAGRTADEVIGYLSGGK